jgi:hypothetical protein
MPQISRHPHITRQRVRENLDTIFIFGDNLQEKGFGGQAREMRGEPNAIGIPTKNAPDLRESSFFSDQDLDRVKGFIDAAFDRINHKLKQGYKVVIPTDGVGTGLAQLPTRAPKIHDYINRKIEELESLTKQVDKELLPSSLQRIIKLKSSR